MIKSEAFQKMAKYCAYQERCQSEIRHRLKGSGLSNEEIENVICDLIEQNFTNEERFAKAFVRGKFNQKGWGKNKIKQHLIQKEISEFLPSVAIMDERAAWRKTYLSEILRIVESELEGTARGDSDPYEKAVKTVET